MAQSTDPMIIMSVTGSELTCLVANDAAKKIDLQSLGDAKVLECIHQVNKDHTSRVVKHPNLPYNLSLDHIGFGGIDAVMIVAKPVSSEEKYRGLFDKMDEGFCIIEMLFEGEKPVDYRFLEINRQFEFQTGLQDVIGKTVRELVPDHEHQWFEIYGEVATMGEPKRFVMESEPMRRWFDVNAFRIGDPADKHVAVLFSDITERKRAEEAVIKERQRLYNLFVQSPNLVIVFQGPDHIIEIANKHALRVWGKLSLDQVYNKPLLEAVPELEGQGIKELLDGVYQTGAPYYGIELKVRLYGEKKKDELEDIYFNFVYQPIFDSAQNVQGIMVIANIVTDQVLARMKIEESEKKYKVLADELEKRVVQRTYELQRSNDDLQQFAHVASHDLREPVRKIKTFGSRLENELVDINEKHRTYIRKILVSADRMFTMIEGVLNYSSLDRSSQFELVDLNGIFDDIEVDFELLIGQKNGSILRGDLPVIYGIRVLIHQLFYNLVYNSLKFSAKDRDPLIKVEAKIERKDGRDIHCITVSDNGIGFDPQHNKIIFETFTRLHSKDNYDGTGLGLALCKKIVERHGGTITASGKIGEGAIFSLTLPVVEPTK